MRFRATGAFALHLLVVLTLLFEAAGHDLLCEWDDRSLARAVDQVAGTDRPAPTPNITHGTPSYEQECPCCLRGGQRFSLVPTPTSWHPLRVAQASRAPDGVQPTRQLPASHTSRGPPAS